VDGDHGFEETEAEGAPAADCPSCGEPLTWSQTAPEGSGCLLAICSCGRPTARFPRRPGHEPDDPIRAAFGSPHAPARPPWIRLFHATSSHPHWLPWRQVPRPCPSCRQSVTFCVWTQLPERRTAYSELCLACGLATSEYLGPRGGMREAPVSGSEWTPPCVAVARLRRAVFAQRSDEMPGAAS
jgi:hypothetical protein